MQEPEINIHAEPELPQAEALTPEEQLARDVWPMQEVISQRVRRIVHRHVRSHTGHLLIARLPARQRDLMVNLRYLLRFYPEGVSLKVLARELAITPPTVSVMVESLVEMGFLTRTTSSRDRRVKLIGISEWSKRLFQFSDKIIGRELARHMEGIPPNYLSDALEKLKNVANKLEAKE